MERVVLTELDVIDPINPANEEITGSIISASKDVDDAVKLQKKF